MGWVYLLTGAVFGSGYWFGYRRGVEDGIRAQYLSSVSMDGFCAQP